MKDDTGFDPLLCELLEGTRPLLKRSSHPLRVKPLAGDGSNRRFFRIRQGDTHFVALLSSRRVPNGLDENDSYFLIGKHLYGHRLPVPRFFLADPQRGFFLMEDLGDYHLQRRADRSAGSIDALYRRVLRLLIEIHRKAPMGFEQSFCFDSAVYDPEFVYRRELEYFRESFLTTYLGLEVGAETLRGDFENLAEAAGVHEHSFVIHRDFQSRNLLLRRGFLRLLDFQGMRFGPPPYDLASLMLDPYVQLPSCVQKDLVEFYWSGARGFLNCSRRVFQQRYFAVRLSRNLQVLGAYGFLGIVKGKAQFLRYIPRAWSQLQQWINGPCSGQYPNLEKLINSIQHPASSI
jgi:aminoglycoside/choline kinase family phosphotransferase